MPTTQVSPNGHHPLPPPLPVENPAQQNPPGVTATKEKDMGCSYPLKRRISTPTDPYASEIDIDTTPLPDRCQFFFSGGRQCRMLRSEIHPNLCPFHAARDEELFNPPHHAWQKVNTRPDLPELYCACEDLGTAAGVNRALAHVFRMLALRRITRQEAATFGHLAQLLLRTISAMRAEADDAASIGVPSENLERGTPLPYHPTPQELRCSEEQIMPPSACDEIPRAAHFECASEPQSHPSSATAESSGGQHSSSGARAASTRAGNTKRSVPDFASLLSASRTALASTAPHTDVPPNHPSIENVRQLPQNQHLRNRGT